MNYIQHDDGMQRHIFSRDALFDNPLVNSLENSILSSVMSQCCHAPLKIYASEQRSFQGRRFASERLLHIARAPQTGWTVTDIQQVLSDFYLRHRAFIKVPELQIFLGRRWVGHPKSS